MGRENILLWLTIMNLFTNIKKGYRSWIAKSGIAHLKVNKIFLWHIYHAQGYFFLFHFIFDLSSFYLYLIFLQEKSPTFRRGLLLTRRFTLAWSMLFNTTHDELFVGTLSSTDTTLVVRFIELALRSKILCCHMHNLHEGILFRLGCYYQSHLVLISVVQHMFRPYLALSR